MNSDPCPSFTFGNPMSDWGIRQRQIDLAWQLHQGKTRCSYCQIPMLPMGWRRKKNKDRSHTRQHILPVRRGGDDAEENLRPCCYGCNSTLALVDDCPAALACMVALGEAMGLGAGNVAAKGAIFATGAHKVALDSHASWLKLKAIARSLNTAPDA